MLCGPQELCPEFFTCDLHTVPFPTCKRATCTRDTDCSNGACVEGSCYARVGLCQFPVP